MTKKRRLPKRRPIRWCKVKPHIRNAVLFTMDCFAGEAEVCPCGRTRCRQMAQGYRAAIQKLMAATLDGLDDW